MTQLRGTFTHPANCRCVNCENLRRAQPHTAHHPRSVDLYGLMAPKVAPPKPDAMAMLRLLARASNHLSGYPDPVLHADICACLLAHDVT